MHGFLGGWLRRTGRRPGRWLCLVWLALLGAALLLGLVGFEQRTWPRRPPGRGAVDYASFLPGGERAGESALGPLRLDPALVPPRDPSIVEPVMSLFLWDAGDGRPHLVFGKLTREGRYGWPLCLIDWRAGEVWDVSDPGAPFAPLRGYWKPYFLRHLDAISIGRPDEDGSWLIGYRVFWSSWLLVLALSILAAVVIVLPTATWFRVRRRRRRRRGACAACGHLLGPAPHTGPCPECGAGS